MLFEDCGLLLKPLQLLLVLAQLSGFILQLLQIKLPLHQLLALSQLL